MSAYTTEFSPRARTRSEVRTFLEQVLDEMPLTERPYHLLHYSLPLVAELVLRTQRAIEPGDKVLLIGGNSLLGNALLELGYEVDIWGFPNQSVSDEMKPHIVETVTPESLAGCAPGKGQYRAILAPLVLESLSGDIAEFLSRLREGLSEQGTLIVATANQSRLDTRLAALTGKAFSLRRKAMRLSLSWPALPTVHEPHRSELITAGRAAGFSVHSCDYVLANRLFLELDVLPIEQYALRKATNYFQQAVPSIRDTLVMELRSRVPDNSTWTDEPLFVSVFVSAVNGGERLERTLIALVEQTYPEELYDIVVIHDGSRPDVLETIDRIKAGTKVQITDFVSEKLEGPSVRNAAMVQAKGDVSGHTDDSCHQPADWIEAAVLRFDKDTALVSGPVFAEQDSEPRFLEVPGLRPEPADDQIWRNDLYPITNVFYRTAVAVSAGGFSRRFEDNGGTPAAGWDAELAWRLQRMGWQARFREEVFTFRTFPAPSGRRIPTQHKVASELPVMYARVPELKSALLGGVFASKQTMYFDLMLLCVALAAKQRRWPWLVGVVPWLGLISKRLDAWPPTQWRHSARLGVRLGALHLSWLGGFIKGSWKAKRLVL